MTTLVDAIEAAKAARAERHTQVDQGKEAGQERLQELKKALLLRSPSGFSFEFAPEGLSVSSSTAVIGYWTFEANRFYFTFKGASMPDHCEKTVEEAIQRTAEILVRLRLA